MKVLIDSREQLTINRIAQHYETSKEKYPNIESIEVEELPTGDLCTSDNYFGNERKSDKDFIPSLLGGRLKQQLYELRHQYKLPLLVVEGYDGIIDCIQKNPQIHPNVIIGAVTSALAHNGVHIQFVGGFYVPFILDTVNKLYDGERQLYETFGYTSIRTHDKSKNDFLKYFLLGLPGVRYKVCQNIVKRFNTVESVVNASVEDLKQVKGISEENAKKIKELFK